VIAVSHAPLSMVAVMMQGGIGLFVICSVLFFGERARPAEWAGIVAIVMGMLLLSLSLSGGASQGATDERAIVAISAHKCGSSHCILLGRGLLVVARCAIITGKIAPVPVRACMTIAGVSRVKFCLIQRSTK